MSSSVAELFAAFKENAALLHAFLMKHFKLTDGEKELIGYLKAVPGEFIYCKVQSDVVPKAARFVHDREKLEDRTKYTHNAEVFASLLPKPYVARAVRQPVKVQSRLVDILSWFVIAAEAIDNDTDDEDEDGDELEDTESK